MKPMKNIKENDTESRILGVAKKLFIENGFTDTNMSDIAAGAGLNRPVLHYYFRTKDRMFQAVFSKIVMSFLPEIKEVVVNRELTLRQRVSQVIDAYYKRVFKENPCLPMFMIREINRDAEHLLAMVKELRLDTYIEEIAASLQKEMNENKLKKVPLRTVFLTFYGLLVMPCLSRNLISLTLLEEGETFDDLLTAWKPYIVSQMEHLLAVDEK